MSTHPFLVLGAMKSGTTTLHAVLAAHPDVEIVGEKETSSFLDRAEAARAAERMRGSTRRAAGQVTTAYLQHPLVAPPVATVHDLLGDDVRLVAILREPFGRAMSHWRHWRQLGREQGPVDVVANPDGPYVAFSSYHRQLQPWLDAFGRDRLHVLRLEDYETAPAATTAALWRFLDVPVPDGPVAVVHENAAERRVVATGWKAAVWRSPWYQRVVRPLLPATMRRGALTAVGGAAGRGAAPTLSDSIAPRFHDAVAADLAMLRAQWPHLAWEATT